MKNLLINDTPIRTKGGQISLLDVSKAVGYTSRALHRFVPQRNIQKTLVGGYQQTTAGPKAVVEGIKACSYYDPEYVQAIKDAYPGAFEEDTQAVSKRKSKPAAKQPKGLQAIHALFADSDIRIVNDDPVTVVLADVAKALGYRDSSTISRSIKDKYLVTHKVCDAVGRLQSMTCVTRPGLTDALPGLTPQDEAKREKIDAFCEWLAEDVMEAIYETGSYNAQQKEPSVQQPSNVLDVVAKAQEQIDRILGVTERVQTLQEKRYEDKQKRLEAAEVEEATYEDLEYAHLIDQPAELKSKFTAKVTRVGGDGKQGKIYSDVYEKLCARYGVDVGKLFDSGSYESKVQALLDHHTEEKPMLLWAINLLR